jgi:arginine/serine-rich splicing factor 16
MPWQGRPDVLIDRFDVRAHLDYIPENPTQTESTTNEELLREDRLANYERYRIIVQNDFLGSKLWSCIYLTLQISPSVFGVSRTVVQVAVDRISKFPTLILWHISERELL